MILVVGSTGNLGGAIARMLLAQGKQVSGLVRPQSPYQPLVEAGLQPVLGDLKDPASLKAACANVDTVITTANAALRGGEDTFETVDTLGNRNLIDAARAAGVKQFIFVSALGADTSSPNPLYKAKALTEAYLKASGIPYTILQPDAFMEVWPAMVVGMPALTGKPVKLVGEALRKHSYISAGDVAAFAVAAVDHPKAMNAALALGGPEALSYRDVATVYGKVLGRTITAEFVAQGEPIEHLPPVMVQLLAALESFDTVFDTAPLAATFGVKQTRLEEVVRRTATAAG